MGGLLLRFEFCWCLHSSSVPTGNNFYVFRRLKNELGEFGSASQAICQLYYLQ